MPLQSYNTVVTLPNNSSHEVAYYCSNKKLSLEESKKSTQLFIQLHDCICILTIDKKICKDRNKLENIVHNKVINARGHLC
jgi:hypothetical protein